MRLRTPGGDRFIPEGSFSGDHFAYILVSKLGSEIELNQRESPRALDLQTDSGLCGTE
jgi:hypothetical protein